MRTPAPAKSLPSEVSTAQLLDLTGLPRRTLTGWKAQGLVTPTDRGRWPLAETMRAILTHYRTQPQAQTGRNELIRHQARLKRIQADQVERVLIPRAECEAGWVTLAGLFVTALESLPSRLATAIAGAESAGEIRGLLKREVNGVRAEVAAELDRLASEAREG